MGPYASTMVKDPETGKADCETLRDLSCLSTCAFSVCSWLLCICVTLWHLWSAFDNTGTWLSRSLAAHFRSIPGGSSLHIRGMIPWPSWWGAHFLTPSRLSPSPRCADPLTIVNIYANLFTEGGASLSKRPHHMIAEASPSSSEKATNTAQPHSPFGSCVSLTKLDVGLPGNS